MAIKNAVLRTKGLQRKRDGETLWGMGGLTNNADFRNWRITLGIVLSGLFCLLALFLVSRPVVLSKRDAEVLTSLSKAAAIRIPSDAKLLFHFQGHWQTPESVYIFSTTNDISPFREGMVPSPDPAFSGLRSIHQYLQTNVIAEASAELEAAWIGYHCHFASRLVRAKNGNFVIVTEK